MKILILGGRGFLGSSIMTQALLKNITVYGTSRTISNSINIIKADVSNKTSLLSLLDKTIPDVIIWTLMSDKNEIELVNNGLLNLLSLIKKESKLIFMSTDAIFTGGTGSYVETDKTELLPCEAPLANYVNGKHIGENLIKHNYKNHMIIRTGPIYGNSLNVEKRTVRIIQQIKSKESVKAPTNLYRCFVHVEDLSKALWGRDEKGKPFIEKEFPHVPKEHGFSDVVDNYSRFSEKFPLVGGDKIERELYQITGSNNGKKVFLNGLLSQMVT